MSPHSHLPLIRRYFKAAKAVRSPLALERRYVLRVDIFQPRWLQEPPRCLVIYREDDYEYWYKRMIPVSPQLWIVYGYFFDLIGQRFASCHHVLAYH